MPFLAGLALLFIGLKLSGIIAWPWLWVLAPLWMPNVFVLSIFVVIVLSATVIALVKSR